MIKKGEFKLELSEATDKGEVKEKKEFKLDYNPLEREVLSAVVNQIHALGIFAYRQNTMGVYDRKIGGYRKNSNTMKGCADIIGLLKTQSGKFLAVEIKRKGKKKEWRPEQQIYCENIRENGGIYLLVDSIDDLLKQLIENKIIDEKYQLIKIPPKEI